MSYSVDFRFNSRSVCVRGVCISFSHPPLSLCKHARILLYHDLTEKLKGLLSTLWKFKRFYLQVFVLDSYRSSITLLLAVLELLYYDTVDTVHCYRYTILICLYAFVYTQLQPNILFTCCAIFFFSSSSLVYPISFMRLCRAHSCAESNSNRSFCLFVMLSLGTYTQCSYQRTHSHAHKKERKGMECNTTVPFHRRYTINQIRQSWSKTCFWACNPIFILPFSVYCPFNKISMFVVKGLKSDCSLATYKSFGLLSEKVIIATAAATAQRGKRERTQKLQQ